MTTPSNPFISIIMPVHNTQAKFLQEAIESCLNQTYQNFELLIIDDGSTHPDTLHALKNYSKPQYTLPAMAHDPHTKNNPHKGIIRIFSQANGGASSARNLGLTHAQGDFIAFLDSDDIALPKRLEIQVNFLIKNPQIGVLGSSRILWPSNKKEIYPTENEDIKTSILLAGYPMLLSSIMLKKQILLDHNIAFRETIRLAEDHIFWLDLLPHTDFANIKKPLTKYRLHQHNISILQSEKQIKTNRINLVDKWCEYLDFPEQKKQMTLRFLNGEMLPTDNYATIDEMFNFLNAKLIMQLQFKERTVHKHFCKLYKRTLRRCKSAQQIKHMLQKPRTTKFKVNIIHKMKICKKMSSL